MALMKLWELGITDHTGLPAYEIAWKFIIQATSAAQARKLASENSGDEGKEVWLDPKRTSCSGLKLTGKPKVISRESNHS